MMEEPASQFSHRVSELQDSDLSQWLGGSIERAQGCF